MREQSGRQTFPLPAAHKPRVTLGLDLEVAAWLHSQALEQGIEFTRECFHDIHDTEKDMYKSVERIFDWYV